MSGNAEQLEERERRENDGRVELVTGEAVDDKGEHSSQDGQTESDGVVGRSNDEDLAIAVQLVLSDVVDSLEELGFRGRRT